MLLHDANVIQKRDLEERRVSQKVSLRLNGRVMDGLTLSLR